MNGRWQASPSKTRGALTTKWTRRQGHTPGQLRGRQSSGCLPLGGTRRCHTPDTKYERRGRPHQLELGQERTPAKRIVKGIEILTGVVVSLVSLFTQAGEYARVHPRLQVGERLGLACCRRPRDRHRHYKHINTHTHTMHAQGEVDGESILRKITHTHQRGDLKDGPTQHKRGAVTENTSNTYTTYTKHDTKHILRTDAARSRLGKSTDLLSPS